MDESEKRRERLRAMRLQAEQTEAGSSVESIPVCDSLSNPLVENSATQPIQEQSNVTPRFDFYTDPMSAFSANKKEDHPNRHISYGASATIRPSLFTPEPRNSEMTPSLAHQLQSSTSFDQRMYRARGPYNIAAAYGSPRGMAYPLSMHSGTPGGWSIPQTTTGFESPSNASSGVHFVRPCSGPVRSPSFSYGQGRPHLHSGSFSPGSGHGGNQGPSSGRGRGRGYGGSLGFGRSGGRCRRPEGSQGPECFYRKSMDENPWQQLEPIVWKGRSLSYPVTSNSWLPESIIMKKVRVSEASSKSGSQPSLAEYLAASFNEAANEAPNS